LLFDYVGMLTFLISIILKVEGYVLAIMNLDLIVKYLFNVNKDDDNIPIHQVFVQVKKILYYHFFIFF